MRAMLAEILGLFVDDGRYALAILGWLVIAWLVLPHLGLPPAWPPAGLFSGLAAILLWSAVARARKGRG
jgi:hypothetical protein